MEQTIKMTKTDCRNLSRAIVNLVASAQKSYDTKEKVINYIADVFYERAK